jgi:hypothetical protein
MKFCICLNEIMHELWNEKPHRPMENFSNFMKISENCLQRFFESSVLEFAETLSALLLIDIKGKSFTSSVDGYKVTQRLAIVFPTVTSTTHLMRCQKIAFDRHHKPPLVSTFASPIHLFLALSSSNDILTHTHTHSRCMCNNSWKIYPPEGFYGFEKFE